MKSFRRSLKAISPIFATLILIAIAVIAGVVVYMFTSGTLATMTGQGTTGQEKISIQAVAVDTTVGLTYNDLTVYAQAIGNPVTITNAIVKDAGGNVVGTVEIDTTGAANVVGTSLTEITVPALTSDIPPTITITYASGAATYTVTLVGAGGGSFVSPAFTVTGPTPTPTP